ncbi:MAG TPA: hypothetical protein VG366_03115 [Solirubrobacteraceae bacterium]|nr:hypothetical protein [Solirubrobacteraceae bacterium]
MRLAPPRTLLALLGALLLAGCGKGVSNTSSSGGPINRLAPVAAQGALSVATRNTTRLGGGDVATDAAAVARTVYPALTTASRPQAVVLVDRRSWNTALAASSLAGAPLGAPLLFSDGNSLPAVTRETLEALAPVGASALGGAQVLRIGTTAALPRAYVTRSLPAAQPEVTAAAIAGLLGQSTGHTPRQVIVLPDNAPRALAAPAAGLSAESGAPILFVSPARVPAPTAAALVALKRPAIYVLDAPALGQPALSELGSLGTVTELPSASAGEAAGPVANAIAVARFADGQFGWGVKEPGHGLVFANASRPLDGPAAALLSATGDYGPLLLLEGAAAIPTSLAAYLGDIQPAYTPAFDFRPVRGVYNHGWLIGDEHAISAVTQAQIDSLLEISPRKQSGEPSVSQVE